MEQNSEIPVSNLCKAFDLERRHTTPFQPQSRKIERFYRTLKSILELLVVVAGLNFFSITYRKATQLWPIANQT